METPHPHGQGRILRRGPEPPDARATVVLVHGRGDSAAGILGLAAEFRLDDVSWVAPEAAGHTWYPLSFLVPTEQNEPYLGSALRRIREVVDDLTSAGVAPEQIVLMGFSQGACLAQEFAARHARRYGGVVGLSGGLIGPPGTPREYAGSFDGTPVFLGCSDVDPHIPVERVHESADVFRRMKAAVDERIYPRMGHTVNRDEIEAVAEILRRVQAGRREP